MNMFSKKKKQLNEDYVRSGVAKVDDKDIDLAAKNQGQVANKIINSSMLRKYAELGKVMYGMLQDYRRREYTNVPWFTIASITFSFLYILNPMDLMPDFIPGIGYIDDFAVFTFALRFIETDLHNYLDWKLEAADKESE